MENNSHIGLDLKLPIPSKQSVRKTFQKNPWQFGCNHFFHTFLNHRTARKLALSCYYSVFYRVFYPRRPPRGRNSGCEHRGGYNLVVDSNVLSPSTYAPSVATVMGKFCNSGGTDLTGVKGYIGTFAAGAGTPGIYPTRDSADVGFKPTTLAGTGLYSFTHIGGRIGTTDATRFIGTIPAGECRVQYWHFTYPRRGNPNNTGPAVWGASNDPTGRPVGLNFDIWGRDKPRRRRQRHP